LDLSCKGGFLFLEVNLCWILSDYWVRVRAARASSRVERGIVAVITHPWHLLHFNHQLSWKRLYFRILSWNWIVPAMGASESQPDLGTRSDLTNATSSPLPVLLHMPFQVRDIAVCGL
jgi:hypothetical protein